MTIFECIRKNPFKTISDAQLEFAKKLDDWLEKGNLFSVRKQMEYRIVYDIHAIRFPTDELGRENFDSNVWKCRKREGYEDLNVLSRNTHFWGISGLHFLEHHYTNQEPNFLKTKCKLIVYYSVGGEEVIEEIFRKVYKFDWLLEAENGGYLDGQAIDNHADVSRYPTDYRAAYDKGYNRGLRDV